MFNISRNHKIIFAESLFFIRKCFSTCNKNRIVYPPTSTATFTDLYTNEKNNNDDVTVIYITTQRSPNYPSSQRGLRWRTEVPPIPLEMKQSPLQRIPIRAVSIFWARAGKSTVLARPGGAAQRRRQKSSVLYRLKCIFKRFIKDSGVWNTPRCFDPNIFANSIVLKHLEKAKVFVSLQIF